MQPVIAITLSPEARALIAASRSWPRALPRALAAAHDRENEETVGHLVQQRATGVGPFPPSEGRLGVVTGRYRRSVRPSRAVVSGTSIVSAIGSNVRYAGVHEFGFTGTVQVKAHRARNTMLDLVEVRGATVARWQSFGLPGRKTKVASGTVTVRAHERRVNIPARAPIQRGIADRAANYREALSRAAVQALSAT